MFNIEEAKTKLIKEYDDLCEMCLVCHLQKDMLGRESALISARTVAKVMDLLFDDDFLVKQSMPINDK